MRTSLKVLGAFGLLCCVALGCLGFFVWTFLSKAPESPGRDLYFDVPQGAGVSQVAVSLEKQGIITNARCFTLLARFSKLDGKLQAGRFALHTGWLPKKVLEVLVHGRPVLYRVTIPEGLTIWQTATLLQEKGFVYGQC